MNQGGERRKIGPGFYQIVPIGVVRGIPTILQRLDGIRVFFPNSRQGPLLMICNPDASSVSDALKLRISCQASDMLRYSEMKLSSVLSQSRSNSFGSENGWAFLKYLISCSRAVHLWNARTKQPAVTRDSSERQPQPELHFAHGPRVANPPELT
jgi:hypothetical protein